MIRAGEPGTGKRLTAALNSFREMLEALQHASLNLSPEKLIELVLDKTGYLDWVEQQDNIEHTRARTTSANSRTPWPKPPSRARRSKTSSTRPP